VAPIAKAVYGKRRDRNAGWPLEAEGWPVSKPRCLYLWPGPATGARGKLGSEAFCAALTRAHRRALTPGKWLRPACEAGSRRRWFPSRRGAVLPVPSSNRALLQNALAVMRDRANCGFTQGLLHAVIHGTGCPIGAVLAACMACRCVAVPSRLNQLLAAAPSAPLAVFTGGSAMAMVSVGGSCFSSPAALLSAALPGPITQQPPQIPPAVAVACLQLKPLAEGVNQCPTTSLDGSKLRGAA